MLVMICHSNISTPFLGGWGDLNGNRPAFFLGILASVLKNISKIGLVGFNDWET